VPCRSPRTCCAPTQILRTPSIRSTKLASWIVDHQRKALWPTSAAILPSAQTIDLGLLTRQVKDGMSFSRWWNTACMTSDSCWMIPTLGHSTSSRAAWREQSLDMTVSESTMRMTSPKRMERLFHAQERRHLQLVLLLVGYLERKVLEALPVHPVVLARREERGEVLLLLERERKAGISCSTPS
jgi:hypothetical protein